MRRTFLLPTILLCAAAIACKNQLPAAENDDDEDLVVNIHASTGRCGVKATPAAGAPPTAPAP